MPRTSSKVFKTSPFWEPDPSHVAMSGKKIFFSKRYTVYADAHERPVIVLIMKCEHYANYTGGVRVAGKKWIRAICDGF